MTIGTPIPYVDAARSDPGSRNAILAILVPRAQRWQSAASQRSASDGGHTRHHLRSMNPRRIGPTLFVNVPKRGAPATG